MEYDQKKSKNYTHVLRVYLENNMNIAKTVSQLYLHRQTFLYQLDIIKNIIGINLDDKDAVSYTHLPGTGNAPGIGDIVFPIGRIGIDQVKGMGIDKSHILELIHKAVRFSSSYGFQ